MGRGEFGAVGVVGTVSGKRSPQLKLITPDGQGTSGGGGDSPNAPFTIIALNELSQAEQEKIRRLSSQIAPGAAVIGVMQAWRSWDVRPVVMLSGEKSPSVIRFLGPEVTLSVTMSARIQDLYERLTRHTKITSEILGWGVLEGQLWYRREIVDMTLAEIVKGIQPSHFSDVITLAKGLVTELRSWQELGLTHGHLTPQNIRVSQNGKVSFLDSGTALAIVQAANWLQMESFPEGYDRASFAPESITSESLILSTDIYGLGLIFGEMFDALEKQFRIQPSNQQNIRNRPHLLTSIQSLRRKMLDSDPKRRPQLDEVSRLLDESVPTYSVAVKPQPAEEKAETTLRERVSPADFVDAEPIRGKKVLLPASQSNAAERIDFEPPAVPASAPIRSEITPEVRERTPTIHFPEEANPNPTPRIVEITKDEPREPNFESGKQSTGKNQNLNSFFFWGLVIAALALGYRFLPWQDYLSGSIVYKNEDLHFAWHSGIPSRMKIVAQAAVNPAEPNAYAENLIVESAMKGEELGDEINVGLIRVAFDKRWELELKPEDRRTALVIALGALLQESTPSDLPALEEPSRLHPGVILALTATGGEQASKSLLSRISAKRLTELPAPFKSAFRMLLQGSAELVCSDDAVRAVARMGTRGIDDPAQVMTLLQEDTERRLRALTVLFAEDDAQSKRLLAVLLEHPNFQLEYPALRWARAKAVKLLEWNELEGHDQLFLLAGLPPSKPVSMKDHLGKLFLHPSPAVRKAAAEQAVNGANFPHPGAFKALQLIVANPELLLPAQTYRLAEILAKYETVDANTIRQWLDSAPPREIVESLLVATSEKETATRLDLELSMYLRRGTWQPDLTTLEKLSHHPEDSTRWFAYSRLFEITDKKVSLKILTGALKRERKPEFREQLQANIDYLKTL